MQSIEHTKSRLLDTFRPQPDTDTRMLLNLTIDIQEQKYLIQIYQSDDPMEKAVQFVMDNNLSKEYVDVIYGCIQ